MKGELLIREHLPAEKILIARPSIIMGDSRPIIPRSPVILWAMATINHLRLIPVNEHSQLDIIPGGLCCECYSETAVFEKEVSCVSYFCR